MPTVTRLLSFFCVFALNYPVVSAVISFDSQFNSDWNQAINWNPDLSPSTHDFVQIMNGMTTELTPGTTAFASYIDVRDSGTLNVTGGSLSFGFANNRWFWVGWNSTGTVNQTGGNISAVGGNVDVVVDSFGTYNMAGGTLNISDDLRMNGDAVFNIAGTSELIIGDDFRLGPAANVEFNVELIGDTPPTINVSDDLVLRDGMTLNIDTTYWTGDTGPIALFNVGDRISGQFTQVTVDGVEVENTDYAVSSGSFLIPVSESTSPLVALLGVAGMCVLFSRRPRRTRTATTAAGSGIRPHHTRRQTPNPTKLHRIPMSRRSNRV